MKNIKGKIIANIIAILVCILWLLPIIWMIVVAVKPETANTLEVSKWFVPPFTLDNFKFVLNYPQANIGLWLINSTIVSVLVTIGVLVLCSLAAFAFSRINFKGKDLWFFIIMAGLMVPKEATIIPLYILFKNMDKLNTYFSLIAPSLAAPFGLIILKQFFDGIPSELFDAAKIDGCGLLKTLLIIVIPLSKSALSSLGIFVFLASWNDFLWPFISITDPKMMTIPIGLPIFKSQYLTGKSITMAASTLTSLPIIIAFLIFQKNIVKGIALTGIKG